MQIVNHPLLQKWEPCDPSAFPGVQGILMVDAYPLTFLFVEEQGRLLLLEGCANSFHYRSNANTSSIVVRRSFFSGRWTIELAGSKWRLRKVARVSLEALKPLPVAPSAGIPDDLLLTALERIDRANDFESAVSKRQDEAHHAGCGSVKSQSHSARKNVEALRQRGQVAIKVMGGGAGLVVLGGRILRSTALWISVHRHAACVITIRLRRHDCGTGNQRLWLPSAH